MSYNVHNEKQLLFNELQKHWALFSRRKVIEKCAENSKITEKNIASEKNRFKYIYCNKDKKT